MSGQTIVCCAHRHANTQHRQVEGESAGREPSPTEARRDGTGAEARDTSLRPPSRGSTIPGRVGCAVDTVYPCCTFGSSHHRR